jgi:hypothetical protein
MVHGFKPGKHVPVKKVYSYHKVGTNPWFQTMILHEVIVSNHNLFQNNYTFQQYSPPLRKVLWPPFLK